jgi:hypothetical protein
MINVLINEGIQKINAFVFSCYDLLSCSCDSLSLTFVWASHHLEATTFLCSLLPVIHYIGMVAMETSEAGAINNAT